MSPGFKIVTCCAECQYLVRLSILPKTIYRCAIGCMIKDVPIQTERPSDCPLPKPEE